MNENSRSQRLVPLIAMLASLAIIVQNSQFVLGFSWALIHGAGIASVRAFLPAAIGLAVLWSCYVVLRRQAVRRMPLIFTACALGIVLANDWVLPGTPLKAWIDRRSIEAVEVRNLRDDLLLSARGNPIGIRITFDAVVPRTGEYGIAASAMMPAVGHLPWPLHFGKSVRHNVQPPPRPSSDSDSVYDVYEKGVVYTFTQDMIPSFLGYDERQKVLCLENIKTPYISEADFLLALTKSRDMRYRGDIEVSKAADRVVVAENLTSRGYDIDAMYRSIELEGNHRCKTY